MIKKSQLGKDGEDFASAYLAQNGYKIIERNFRTNFGELDIIAISKDRTLVFFEVKTMKDFNSDGIKPEDQMTFSKIKKTRRIASYYAGMNQDILDEKKGWRIDMLSLTKIGNDFLVKHYENI